MLYRNNVIKYGLVGPRGAWIAGGIEFSFPFAHTTDTVSNVESAVHPNADGSATAFVGAIDWVSNMYWQIELTLRPGAARLEEGVTLFNATPLHNLYLFWTNTAVPATDDLQYLYPMRETISDDPFAIVQSWPVWNGIDQSWYRNNPSATAIFARDVHRNFFGVYYHQSNYGVVHVSDFRQDPGKKLWSWGTARSGRIWDDILSDSDGPYNEIQSGRFATQGYREFMEPSRVEQWTEYWYPVSDLDGGFVEATPQLALNATFIQTPSSPSGEVNLLFSPVSDLRNATVTVSLGSTLLRTIRDVQLHPLHSAAYTIPVPDLDRARKELSVKVQSEQGNRSSRGPRRRPSMEIRISSHRSESRSKLQSPSHPRRPWKSSISRAYSSRSAETPTRPARSIDRFFNAIPVTSLRCSKRPPTPIAQQTSPRPNISFTSRSSERTKIRWSPISRVSSTARRAASLSRTTPSGLSSITVRDPHPGSRYRPHTWSLGEIAIRQASYASAVDLLERAVEANPADAVALADLAVAERLSGDLHAAAATSAKARQQMPLLPYALAESWQDTAPSNASALTSPASQAWAEAIRSDPQNYLAIAAWYHDLGAWQSSDAVLKAAITAVPAQSLSPMVYYYLAANSRQEGDPEHAAQFATRAASLPIAEVFPNTITDAAVLTEAVQQNPQDAHARYALGNFLFAHSRYDEAAALWSAALDQKFVDPVLLRNLGIYRWHVKDDLEGAARNYTRAIQLSPKDFRLYTDLDEIYEEQPNAAARAALFRDAPPDVLDRDTVRARRALFFIEQSQPAQALALLVDHTFKPWEGGVVIHNIFVRANIEKGKMALAATESRRKPRRIFRRPCATRKISARVSLRSLSQRSSSTGSASPSTRKAKQRKPPQPGNSAVTAAAGKDDVFSALALKKLGQENLARQMLERCVDRANRPDAEPMNDLAAGLASRYLADDTKAQEYFRRALVLDPLFWEARVAMADRDIPE